MVFELMPFVQGKIPLAYPSPERVLWLVRSNYLADEKRRFVNTEHMRSTVGDSEILRLELDKTPMRRFAEPVEIAEAICFLASPMSSFMSGASLVVDG